MRAFILFLQNENMPPKATYEKMWFFKKLNKFTDDHKIHKILQKCKRACFILFSMYFQKLVYFTLIFELM